MGADELNDFIFLEEVDFAFGGVYIDVNPRGVYFQGQVDEGVSAFHEKSRICVFNSFLHVIVLDRAIVDEEKEGGPLDSIVGVTRPAMSLEAELAIIEGELDQLVGNAAAMNLANFIQGSRCRLRRDGRA